MMEAKAVVKFVRVPPRKARLVVDAVRGKHVQDALAILKFTPNFAARTVEKLIMSAAANAENNHHMNPDALKVVHICVDEGPRLKRIQPRAHGRAFRIIKRTSHISVGLVESEIKPKRGEKKGIARTATAAPRTRKPAAKAEAAKPAEKAKASKAEGATAEAPKKRASRRKESAEPKGGE
jgi:large subunit ribosomal protein L22